MPFHSLHKLPQGHIFPVCWENIRSTASAQRTVIPSNIHGRMQYKLGNNSMEIEVVWLPSHSLGQTGYLDLITNDPV